MLPLFLCFRCNEVYSPLRVLLWQTKSLQCFVLNWWCSISSYFNGCGYLHTELFPILLRLLFYLIFTYIPYMEFPWLYPGGEKCFQRNWWSFFGNFIQIDIFFILKQWQEQILTIGTGKQDYEKGRSMKKNRSTGQKRSAVSSSFNHNSKN